MKKREVLEWPPCLPPDFTAEIKGTRGTLCLYRAVTQLVMSEGEDVLEADIFSEMDGLMLRYFADEYNKKHKALIMTGPRAGEWTDMALQNAVSVAAGGRPDEKWTVYETSSIYWSIPKHEYRFASKDDERRVVSYLGQAIEYWETEIEHDKFLGRRERRLRQIEKMMQRVIPPLPEDFEDWIRKSLFDREYLFIEKKPKTIRHTCTACGKTFIRKIEANGRCPKCGAKVRPSIEKSVSSRFETVYLLQELLSKDGWVERKFSTRRRWNMDGSSDIHLYEEIRILIEKNRAWGTCFYLYKDGGRQCYQDSNTFSYRYAKGLLYPGNLREVSGCWPDDLKHMGIEILAARGEKFNVNNAIISGNKTVLEYMIKGGFRKLACEKINNSPRVNSSLMDAEGKTDIQALRLDPARIARLKNMDGGHIALGWLQYEKAIGGKLSQANLDYLERHGISKGNSDVWKCLSFVRSPEAFTNYLKKQAKLMKTSPSGVISEWADYLSMAEKQGLNLSEKLFCRPKNLAQAHDACVMNGQKQELENRRQEILKKFPDVERTMNEIREKYEYQGEGFSILVPKNVQDIIREGRTLGHCIDTTDRYFDRIQTKVSFLVFLRKNQAVEVPWYTLEIEPGGTIRQQRTTGNRQNKKDVEAYTPFIRIWQQVIRERMTEKDRLLAAASEEARIREYRELRQKRETVWHGPMAGRLLADVLEADLIRA